MESESKQLVLMTGEELVSMIETMIERKLQEHLAAGARNDTLELAYGLEGIAQTFGCSRRQAQRIKDSHVIDGAISQVGQVIVTDVREALRLTSNAAMTQAIQAQTKNQAIRRKTINL